MGSGHRNIQKKTEIELLTQMRTEKLNRKYTNKYMKTPI